jgi:phosphate/sulfate permease
MAARPRQFALSWKFSLRSLLYVTALVALFYGLRRSYLMTAFDLEEAIERARNVPTLLTLAATLIAAIMPQNAKGNRWPPAVRGAILGATVGTHSCLALVIEFGEMLRRMDYWNWWENWPLVAPYLIVAMVQGGAIGAFVFQLSELLRFLLLRQRMKSPIGSRLAL